MQKLNMTRSDRINALLNQSFNLLHVEIINESYQHHVPSGSETHFKVVLISNDFDGLSLVKRHQLVQTCLADELKNGLHALSLHLYTAKEWESRSKATTASPNCRDGYTK